MIIERFRMMNNIKLIIIINIITRLVFTNKLYIRLLFTTSITPTIDSRIREHTIGVT